MGKEKKMKFYWEEPDEEDRKQKCPRSVLANEVRHNSLPIMKFSFRLPKMQAISGNVSIRKNEKEITAEIPVPGYGKDDIDVRVSPDSLRIRCEKKKGGTRKDDRSFFSMSSISCMEKTISLPDEVDAGNYKASMSGSNLVVVMQRAKKKKFRIF